MPFYRKPFWRWLYLLFILLVFAALVLAWQQSNRLDTDLTSLLPRESQTIQAQLMAKERMNRRMNRDIVVLVGSNNAEVAMAAAESIQSKWQNAHLFQFVSGKTQPDLAALQADIRRLSLAVVPADIWSAIIQKPSAAFTKQAQALVNPFNGVGIVPVEQDWLGLSTAIMHNISQDSLVFFNAETGWLNIEDGEKTWVLLRARLPEKAGLINVPDELLPLLQHTQLEMAEQNVEVLMAGGSIFAAENKTVGEKEGQYMSVLGMGLTFLLLLFLFRSWRILLLVLPLLVGVLLGLAATVALFGQIHILTLVVGTSLAGVLLDFPLHWLASSIVQKPWQRWQALHVVTKAFLLSLIITLLGYVSLLITPLPILQQTAVFSAVALISAFLFNLLWLPFIFANVQLRIGLGNLRLMLWFGNGVIRCRQWLLRQKWPLLLILLLIGSGLVKLNTHDDIRQWINLPYSWLKQAEKIGKLTQTMPAAQYFIVMADDDDDLLRKSHSLTQQLNQLVEQKQLLAYQSLDQWVVPLAEQKQRQQELRKLQENADHWQELLQLGIDEQSVPNYLYALQRLPAQSISQSLNTDLATAWQDLYLGKMTNGKVAAMVTLSGVIDVSALQKMANNQHEVYFINDLQQLNQLFWHTRNLAIGLKLASYLLAIGILSYVFGWRKGLTLLAVPVTATLLSVALFALFGWTMSLFAIFGLFLVTAIGLDYAIYVSMSQMTAEERLAGVMLAATTTMISFAILGFSATPAIASFGRSVAFGVFFSVILALALLPKLEIKGLK